MNLKRFKDIDKTFSYVNSTKYKSLCVYDTLDEEALDYILNNVSSIKESVIEITLNQFDKNLLDKVLKNGFKPNYYWYKYRVDENMNTYEDKNILFIKNRRKVKKHFTDQVHELSNRMPELFNKNGEEKNWYKCGDKCVGYVVDETIVSLLTYSYEKITNNIHVYLTYTLPNFRSLGYGSKLLDYIKYVAYKDKVDSITICTDVSKDNRVVKMLLENKFEYFKTGYSKLIKEKKYGIK